jgi:adenylate cyclase
MEKKQLLRKLAVILHADVVGSTSLVQQNETLAHERIQAVFQQFSETINSYGGTTRELRGDALVAEFERASDAVPAALAFQAINGEFNSSLDDDIKPQLRIGISLGEVIIADNTITGAGVVLAQRLEQLAEPGGAVVQGSVSETIPARMPFKFDSLGEQVLKGFDHPVRAFAVKLQPGEALPEPEVSTTPQKADSTTLEIHDKPSIAVLPFNNMSGDPEQEYFSDGITEDIITELSRFKSLFVIARNSSFVFKGQAVDVTELGKKLGAQFILEGSVRKAGDRIRITAQLIDTVTGNHVWADRYDRQLEDIFDLQDEMAETISARIEPELGYAERDKARKRATEDLGAWDLYQRGMWHLYRFTPEDTAAAYIAFDKAINADPDFSAAYTGRAYLQLYDVMNGYSSNFENSLRDAETNVRRALSLDSRDVLARFTLGRLHMLKLEYEEAIKEFERCVELNPGFAQVYHGIGFVHAFAGRPEDAIPFFDKAIRLSPQDPHLTSFLAVRSSAYLLMSDYDKAVESAEDAISQPNAMIWPHIFRTSALGHQGSPKAETALKELLNYSPGLNCDEVRRLLYYIRKPEDLEQCINGLLQAGLSE